MIEYIGILLAGSICFVDRLRRYYFNLIWSVILIIIKRSEIGIAIYYKY